jgi:putative flavoprotein involved in K+ transport
MASEGTRLVGRLEAIDGTRAHFRSDLNDNLRFADTFFETRFRADCDAFVERVGEALPEDEPATFAYDVPEVPELDLAAEGIGTVLWTSGYRPTFGWIEFPVLDDFGLPIQANGRTAVDGLAFIGTPWLVDMGSANLIGLVRDAEAIAATW